MKYVPFPSSRQASAELIDFIPHLKNNFSELRQWTLRKQVIYTPQPQLKDEFRGEIKAPEPAVVTPQPKVDYDDNYFDSFEDIQQQIQKHAPDIRDNKEDFFEEDPFSIPLNQWREPDWNNENSPCYED